MPDDIDLKPSEYRVKRGPIRRFLSSRPYYFWIWPSAIWLVGIWYIHKELASLGHPLLVAGLSAIPAVIMLLWWVLSGGSDRHD